MNYEIDYYIEMARTTMKKIVFENGMTPDTISDKLNRYLKPESASWTADCVVKLLYSSKSEISSWISNKMLLCIPKFIKEHNCSNVEFVEALTREIHNVAMCIR